MLGTPSATSRSLRWSGVACRRSGMPANGLRALADVRHRYAGNTQPGGRGQVPG
jgi:hypothetical protein